MRVEHQLSPEQVKLAALMHNGKQSWRSIARELGVPTSTVRKALYPEWSEDRAAYLRRLRKIRGPVRKEDLRVNHKVMSQEKRVWAPPEVLAERDRRLSADYESFTAEFMGDPRRGYSALAKRS